MKFPLDYNDGVEQKRTHPNLFPKNEADTSGGILEMMPERVRAEDTKKAVKLASNATSENVVVQAIVDGGKYLSQRSDKRPLGQRRSVLEISAPLGSGVRTGHKISIQRVFCIRRWRSIYRANQISPSKINHCLDCSSD